MSRPGRAHLSLLIGVALALSVGAAGDAAAQSCPGGCWSQVKACIEATRATKVACRMSCRTNTPATGLGVCMRACTQTFRSGRSACRADRPGCVAACSPPIPPTPPPGCIDDCGTSLDTCARGTVSDVRTCLRGCRTAAQPLSCLQGCASRAQRRATTCPSAFDACLGGCGLHSTFETTTTTTLPAPGSCGASSAPACGGSCPSAGQVCAAVSATGCACVGTTYFVDGGCPSSGSGLGLTCGPSGPFRTIGECVVAIDAARGEGCDIRGAHAAEPAHASLAFDGFYFEPLWMDDAPPAGVRGQSLDCEPSRCIIEGCRAAHGCPVDERPTVRGMTRRTWTSQGGGVWSHAMEATPEPGRSGVNTNRTGTAGLYDPYELFEDDGNGPYNLAYAGDNVATPGDGQWSFNPTTLVVTVNPTGSADPNTAVWVPHFSDLAWATSPSSNVTVQDMDFIGSRTVGLDLGTPPAGSLPGFELHHVGVGHLRRMGIHCQSASGIVFDDVHLFNLGRGESHQGAGADSTYGIRCFHIDGFTMQDVLVEGVANAGRVNLSHTPPDSPGHPCSWCTPPWNDPAHTWASNQSNAVQIKQTAGGTMTRVHVRDNQGAAISIDCSRNITVRASDATETGSCVDAWSFTPDNGFNWWSGLSVDGFTCRNAGVDDIQHCAMNLLGGSASERDPGSLPFLVHVTNTFMNGVGFAGICLDTGPNQATAPSDVVIAYNSIQGARVTPDADGGARGIVVNTSSSNVLIENNAVGGIPNEQVIVTAGASGVTSDYDLFDATTAGSCPLRWGGPVINPGPSPSGGTCGTVAAYRTATGNERHGISGNAGFVSPTDEHLAASSAGIDAGICLPGIITVDHDGGARPVGGTCDIGADEFGSVANP